MTFLVRFQWSCMHLKNHGNFSGGSTVRWENCSQIKRGSGAKQPNWHRTPHIRVNARDISEIVERRMEREEQERDDLGTQENATLPENLRQSSAGNFIASALPFCMLHPKGALLLYKLPFIIVFNISVPFQLVAKSDVPLCAPMCFVEHSQQNSSTL